MKLNDYKYYRSLVSSGLLRAGCRFASPRRRRRCAAPPPPPTRRCTNVPSRLTHRRPDRVTIPSRVARKRGTGSLKENSADLLQEITLQRSSKLDIVAGQREHVGRIRHSVEASRKITVMAVDTDCLSSDELHEAVKGILVARASDAALTPKDVRLALERQLGVPKDALHTRRGDILKAIESSMKELKVSSSEVDPAELKETIAMLEGECAAEVANRLIVAALDGKSSALVLLAE
eukprot:2145527-Pleurochrysis_carterae.AAC.2